DGRDTRRRGRRPVGPSLPCRRHHEGAGLARGRSARRARAGLFRRLCQRCARQRAREGALRPIESSPDRSSLQGVRARPPRGLRQGSTDGQATAVDERTPVSIALVDYGAGNLTSVLKAFRAVGADVRLVSQVSELEGARAIVVPGVGHFSVTASLGLDWHTTIRGAL